MEDFFQNLAKFFGGLVGDRNTNAGLSVHKEELADPFNQADKSSIPVPFTYLDNPNNQWDKRTGILYVPAYASTDILGKDILDNKGTVTIYGAELDDGTKLDYDETVKFLDSLAPHNQFQLSKQAIVDVNSDNTVYKPYENKFRNKNTDGVVQTKAADSSTFDSEFLKNLREMMDYNRNNAYGDTAGSKMRYDTNLYKMLKTGEWK